MGWYCECVLWMFCVWEGVVCQCDVCGVCTVCVSVCGKVWCNMSSKMLLKNIPDNFQGQNFWGLFT